MTIEGVHVWHFLPDDRRLRFPPHTYIEPGVVVRAEGPITMCLNGCHGSPRAIDALKYAPGSIVTHCVIRGEIRLDNDKIVGRERECLAIADAARELREFACDEAELELRRRGVEDEREWRCIEISRLFARGEVGVEALREARQETAGHLTWHATDDAAWLAARGVAREAACGEAGAAAWAANQAADRPGAWRDSSREAWNAARERQNRDLERRLRPLLGMAVPDKKEMKDG